MCSIPKSMLFHFTVKPEDRKKLDFDYSLSKDIYDNIISEYTKMKELEEIKVEQDQESRNYDYEYLRKKMEIEYPDMKDGIEKMLSKIFQFYGTDIQKLIFPILDIYSWGISEVVVDTLKDSISISINGNSIELFLNEDALSSLPMHSVITNIRLINMNNVNITYTVI